MFDDPNRVSTAGLVPVLRLAETAGLYDLLDDWVSVASPATTAKVACVVGGMVAGADSVDDLEVLRHGAMARLFGGIRAPSTLGSFLRSFTHGHVQQLDAVNSRLLAGLARACPRLLAGADGLVMVDVDDTIRQVDGYAKQGAAYGYTGVKGLNLQLATVSTPLVAPVIAQARLRAGNTASARGAARMLTQGGRDGPPGRRDRADPRPSGLGLLRVGVRRCCVERRRLVLRDRPGDGVGDPGHHRHP